MSSSTSPILHQGQLASSKPSAARMYDYFLGGSHNFDIDREAAERVLAVNPDVALIARANRAFLRRAVEYASRAGIRQFLDLGSGIPTAGNVHEIAHRLYPTTRVVYVDSDPIAVHHSRALLEDISSVGAVQGDLRWPEIVCGHPDVTRLLDFSQPIAVLLVASLHFALDDAVAYRVVETVRQTVVPGSYLIVSHLTTDGASPEAAVHAQQLYKNTTNPVAIRTLHEISLFFQGWTMVEPGLVFAPQWHPDDPDGLFCADPARSMLLAGIGLKLRAGGGMDRRGHSG